MRKIIKLREGDAVPENAKYLNSEKEPDRSRQYERWAPTKGIRGSIPLFGTETLYRITPVTTFHYYEVETNDVLASITKGEG